MRIKVYHSGMDAISFFEDPEEPGLVIEVFGTFYKKRLKEDPVRKALEVVLSGRGGRA